MERKIAEILIAAGRYASRDFAAFRDVITGLCKEEKDNNEMESGTLTEYKEHFKNFKFSEINKKFRLIEEDNSSVFVPLPIPKSHFIDDLATLEYFGLKDINIVEAAKKVLKRK